VRTENLSGNNVELLGGGFMDFINKGIKGVSDIATSLKDFGKPTTPAPAPAPAPAPSPKGPLGMPINPMTIGGVALGGVALMLLLKKKRR
jgi:hypothetical protein